MGDDNPWPRFMRALSHFAYHVSSGHYILCSVSCCILKQTLLFYLERHKSYGVTDLRVLEGISTSSFFHVIMSFVISESLLEQV